MSWQVIENSPIINNACPGIFQTVIYKFNQTTLTLFHADIAMHEGI